MGNVLSLCGSPSDIVEEESNPVVGTVDQQEAEQKKAATQAKHTKMPASDATKSKEVVAVEAELALAKAEPHKDVPYLKALKSLITALTELSQKEADFTAKKTELEVGHLQ